ncbi:hypothetical protein [Pseudomonas orientalis]|uniref:Intein N-terminal splicing region n=1 Tax=Pseudomonas orientalis TaxID=76758 RepID=A0A0R3A106_9PSED|nr:hypothetical protein [Pseudomonas orientalis]AUZ46332.1 hypothetical protein BOP93_12250 [Pseudomonas orientalis]KRP66917.1 hypothetical protein TU82_07320 [Pseudomonas orientalis]SDT91734.1 intein N-terminal splicing region [Pseudomonas orientalis]
MSLQQCANNYCGNNKNMIDGDCHDLDYQAGNKIVLIPPGTSTQCWCVCSCLAVDTPVATPTGTVKVQDIVADTTIVLAAGIDLSWSEQVVGQASFATPGLTEHTLYIQYLLAGEQAPREIVVTRDHPFLIYPDKHLIVAECLQLTDQLYDQGGQPAQVVDIQWGSYSGSFYEFATSMTPPDNDYTNHLVLTNGVVSGDFAIQVFSDLPGPTTVNTRHEVGSDEWQANNPARTQATVLSVGKPAAQALNAITLRTATGHVFTPAQIVVAPDHAADFLPPSQASALKKFAPKHPIGDTYYHQMGDYVLDQFRSLYPDITFHISWYNSIVNAHSYVTEGEKTILLNGGLLRIAGFEYEGICLAIAHEVGHLYGTPDGSPLGVTCEGEADYYGAKIALRKLWFGELYGNFITKSVDQFKLLYSFIPQVSPDLDKAGRAYPSNDCRLDTISAAMAGQPIPACAACGTVDWSTITPGGQGTAVPS